MKIERVVCSNEIHEVILCSGEPNEKPVYPANWTRASWSERGYVDNAGPLIMQDTYGWLNKGLEGAEVPCAFYQHVILFRRPKGALPRPESERVAESSGWSIEPDDMVVPCEIYRIVSAEARAARARQGTTQRPEYLATVYSRADAERIVRAESLLLAEKAVSDAQKARADKAEAELEALRVSIGNMQDDRNFERGRCADLSRKLDKAAAALASAAEHSIKRADELARLHSDLAAAVTAGNVAEARRAVTSEYNDRLYAEREALAAKVADLEKYRTDVQATLKGADSAIEMLVSWCEAYADGGDTPPPHVDSDTFKGAAAGVVAIQRAVKEALR